MKPAELKAIRKNAGLSQGQLGERLGYTIQMIGNYESGRNPIPPVVELAALYIAAEKE